MKKLFLLIVSCLMALHLSVFADSIGFIDMDQILLNYKDSQKIQDELRKNREDYQKLFEKRQKEVQKMQESKKSEDKIKEKIDEIETELKPKQEELLQYEAHLQRRLLNDIMDASKKVAKEYGIDIVVDKRVIYAGGFDLTNYVVDKLNQTK